MSDHFDIIRPDTLLFVLGAFAEPEPSPRERWVERLTKLRQLPLTDREIAERLGNGLRAHRCTANLVRQWAVALHLPRKMKIFSFAERQAQNAIIADLWVAGYSAIKIGRRLDLAPQTVWQRVEHMKLPKHGRGCNWRRSGGLAYG